MNHENNDIHCYPGSEETVTLVYVTPVPQTSAEPQNKCDFCRDGDKPEGGFHKGIVSDYKCRADGPEHPIVGPEDGFPCCEHCAKHPGSQWTLKVSQPVSGPHRNFICPTDEIQCDWPKCVDPKSGDSYFDVECLKRMNAVSGDAPQCNPVGGIERASKRDLEVITEPIDWEKVENSCCEWNAPKVEDAKK